MRLLQTMGVVAALIVASATGTGASEQTSENYGSVLEGGQVVPPIAPESRIGNGYFSLSETNELSYQIYACQYVGEITEVHVHGPADPGEIGPVIFTIPISPSPYNFPFGSLGVLNDQQIRDLNCGLWYLDFHTAEYPLGVVRGRIRGLWGWEPPNPCALPVQMSTWGAVKSLYR